MKRKMLGLMIAVFAVMLPVFVDAEGNAVKIGTTEYATLKEAVEAVEVCTTETCETTTINVLKSHESSGIKFASGKHIIVDLGGFTVSFKEPTVGSKGTETQDMQILKNSTIVFKNGKLVSSNSEKSKMLIQNYANLTLKDVELVAVNEQSLYALSNNSGDVSIEGTTSIKAKRVAFDVCGYHGYPIGPKVVVNTTGTIEGTIEVTKVIATAVTRELSLIIKNMNHVGEMDIQEGLEDKVTVEIKDSDLYPIETEDGVKYVVADEKEIVNAPYEAEEAMDAKDIEEALVELEKDEDEESQELLAAIKKALEGKTAISAHDIIYGKFIGDNLIVDDEDNQPKEGEKVKVTLNLPETLEKVKAGYNRKYSVVRMHFNYDTDKYEIDVLDAKTNDDNTVSFETDKFSIYFLAYEDVKDTTNPKTSDGILLYVIVGCLSLVGLVFVGKKVKNFS